MWEETVVQLRRKLISVGWESDDLYNIPLIVNRKGVCPVIAVSPGDGRTGSEVDVHGPELRYAKGDVSNDFYNGNFEDMWTRKFDVPGYSPWILVQSLGQDHVAAELSQPAQFEGGRVLAWRKRIVLPRIDFDPFEFEEPVRPNLPEIDFDVSGR
jgi:hypothetical protein